MFWERLWARSYFPHGHGNSPEKEFSKIIQQHFAQGPLHPQWTCDGRNGVRNKHDGDHAPGRGAE